MALSKRWACTRRIDTRLRGRAGAEADAVVTMAAVHPHSVAIAASEVVGSSADHPPLVAIVASETVDSSADPRSIGARAMARGAFRRGAKAATAGRDVVLARNDRGSAGLIRTASTDARMAHAAMTGGVFVLFNMYE